MIQTPVLSLETPDGASIEAGLGRGYRTWEEDTCDNQQEVQAWLDLHLLNNGFYDNGNWFQPAWVFRLKPAAGLSVPGGHKVFRGLTQAPYLYDHAVDKRLEACGLHPIERHISLLWSVLRWAQGGLSDTEIRCNAFEVGFVQDFIPPRRLAPIPPRRHLPDLATILGATDHDR